MQPDFSIIIPVYNEADIVENTLQKIDAYLASQPFTTEVIFIDDGSTDTTLQALTQTPMRNAQKRIIKLSNNFGSHAAIRAGFFHAKADKCMFYYIDMSDDISIIRTFYDKLNDGYAIVCAERVGYRMSLGSRVFSKLQERYICPGFPAGGISIIAINGTVKKVLNENIEKNSSVFLQIFNMGFNKCIVKSQMHERNMGGSKWTLRKKVRLLIDTFVSFSHMPIRAISCIGVVMALCGILYAIIIIAIKVFNICPLAAGWPTMISVMLIGFGITNLSLGIISEYLVRVLDAARNRPSFIVESILDEGNPEA